MYTSIFALCILFYSLTCAYADPAVSSGKPSEGSYADTGLLINGNDKEHQQKLERFVEFRKRLREIDKERHAPDSDDKHERPAQDGDAKHERRAPDRDDKHERPAPDSDDKHRTKPSGDNVERQPAHVTQKNEMRDGTGSNTPENNPKQHERKEDKTANLDHQFTGQQQQGRDNTNVNNLNRNTWGSISSSTLQKKKKGHNYSSGKGKKKHNGSAINRKKHKGLAVSKKKHRGSVVSRNNLSVSAVNKKINRVIAVNQKNHMGSAISKKDHRDSAVNKKKHMTSAVNKKKHMRSAVDTKNHRDSAVNKKNHRDSAVSKKKRNTSVAKHKKHNTSVVNKKKHKTSVVNREKHENSVVNKKKRKSSVGNKKKHNTSVGYKKKHKTSVGNKKIHKASVAKHKKHNTSVVNKKKHKTSVVNREKHNTSVVNKKKRKSSVGNKKKHNTSVGNKKKHNTSVVNKKKRKTSVVNKKKHNTSVVNKKKRETSVVNKEKHNHSVGNKKKHNTSLVNKKKRNTSVVNKKKRKTSVVNKKKHNTSAVNKVKYRGPGVNKKKHNTSVINKKKHKTSAVGENNGRNPKNGIDKEHIQKIKQILELRKRFKQRGIEHQAPDSEDKIEAKPPGIITHTDALREGDNVDSHEAKPLEENGGRPQANGIDKEHKRMLELRRHEKLHNIEATPPGIITHTDALRYRDSVDSHEAKPLEENGGRPQVNGIDKEHKRMLELKRLEKLHTPIAGVNDGSETYGGDKAAAHLNKGSPESISVAPTGITSLLADKALWICMALCLGVCFVMVLLSFCFYKVLVRIRSHCGKPRKDDVIILTGTDEIGSWWDSDEEEVFNVSDLRHKRVSPSVSRTMMAPTSINTYCVQDETE